MYCFQPVDRLVQVTTLVEIYNDSRPQGFYFPGESHDFWEGVYVHEGKVTATADEQVYQLRPGHFLLHKPMEFHRIWSAPDCSPWIVNISFQANGKLLQDLKHYCFDLNSRQQELFWRFVNTFQKAKQLNDTENDTIYRTTTNLAAVLLESFLLELTENKEFSSSPMSPNDERYSKIVQVMKENCHKNLSLDNLADLCQMSTSNMKRIFRLYSDVGIAKYFLTLKIRSAMQLLESGKPAIQVADTLHFSDTAYFYTVFKRETGMTPAEFINQKRKNLLD